MERELLETFEAARKAADAVEDGRGVSEEDRCVDALRRLRKFPVTMNDLVATQVGRRLRSLTKHSHEKIQAAASELLKFWKDIVIVETSKSETTNIMPQNSAKAELKKERACADSEKIAKPGAIKVDIISSSESFVAGKIDFDEGIKDEIMMKSAALKVENNGSGEAAMLNTNDSVMVETISKEEKLVSVKNKASAIVAPPKLSALVKCNVAARDRFREILADALSKVYKETIVSEREEVRSLVDEVDASDPFRVALSVESALFEKLGPSTSAHKLKYRSTMFNLKDSKNTDFRRRVLLGHVKPETLAEMTPEEMASDERKAENQQIKERALFECELGAAPKATTDQFKCGRCGERKCTYYQMQTRSADEPMTTYVTCVNCNNHWKFC